jgi:hypothetical protein
MSNYTIEVSGNQPYYVEVSGSTSNIVYNLETVQTSGTFVEISSDYRNILLNDIPSGYDINLTSGILPISRTSGLLPASRVSGLTSLVVSVATSTAISVVNQSIAVIDGGTP